MFFSGCKNRKKILTLPTFASFFILFSALFKNMFLSLFIRIAT